MERIRIDHTKCTGCHYCELACSLNHLSTAFNPKKARIRVLKEGKRFFPVISGPHTEAACNIKVDLVIGEKVYDFCDLCRAACPYKGVFKDPVTEIPLQCDFCGIDAPGPACVKWCPSGALTLVEVPSYY
ncbi:MAG TPA: (4Fe-4S)-binding protein [Candidatus Desulfofervidus auxilii]|uniref:(4Fe-4S)-binding protein n=1 Tax=Desulfofervidus auxilii TaxID=1621989 RepID=A0A7C0U1S8_DESA2|nr:(4Fe-4S)-binding protein [Candidatus Desulfofervidus auxilii]